MQNTLELDYSARFITERWVSDVTHYVRSPSLSSQWAVLFLYNTPSMLSITNTSHNLPQHLRGKRHQVSPSHLFRYIPHIHMYYSLFFSPCLFSAFLVDISDTCTIHRERGFDFPLVAKSDRYLIPSTSWRKYFRRHVRGHTDESSIFLSLAFVNGCFFFGV